MKKYSVNEAVRYKNYNHVQDPMKNHKAFIETHYARLHKIHLHGGGGEFLRKQLIKPLYFCGVSLINLSIKRILVNYCTLHSTIEAFDDGAAFLQGNFLFTHFQWIVDCRNRSGNTTGTSHSEHKQNIVFPEIP